MTVPYLRSEYGKEYDFDAPVKLLDAMMHEQAGEPNQRVVVLGQVLAADINIGYEDIVNTRVRLQHIQPCCDAVVYRLHVKSIMCALRSCRELPVAAPGQMLAVAWCITYE